MPIEKWSDSITIVHLADDPQFSEDLESVRRSTPPVPSAVMDFGAVHFMNSSNIAHLLRLRRHMADHHAKLILCNLANPVWGTFLVTGLDKIFEFAENVPTGLASLQMSPPK